MALQSEINPKLLNIGPRAGRRLHHHAALSGEGLRQPGIAADLERYIASPGFPSKLRTQILKLVWDLIGTEFAGRHEQYEKFYGGASFLVKQNMARAYDFKAATGLVERALSLTTET
jgi:4-hydroxyphenylacetate 3-monooxygenase